MNSSRKIAWEKFTPIYEVKNIGKEYPEDDIDDEESPTFQDHDDDEEALMSLVNLDELVFKRKIRTPFGYYESDDDFSPYNMFDCWIGHSNFRITKKDFNILDKKIDGIGCLKVISPYRFFIGIERMFNFPCVRIQIQQELCNDLEIQDGFTTVDDGGLNGLISKVNDALFSIKDSEKWAVFVGKDGQVKSIKNSEFESDLEYQNTLINLKSLKNGNIITYDSLWWRILL